MPPIPDREYIFENMRQRRMLSMISRGQFFNTPAMKGGIRLNSSGSQAAPDPSFPGSWIQRLWDQANNRSTDIRIKVAPVNVVDAIWSPNQPYDQNDQRIYPTNGLQWSVRQGETVAIGEQPPPFNSKWELSTGIAMVQNSGDDVHFFRTALARYVDGWVREQFFDYGTLQDDYYLDKDFNYHSVTQVMTTSATSISVPTTHPSSRTITISTGLSIPGSITIGSCSETFSIPTIVPSLSTHVIDSGLNLSTGDYITFYGDANNFFVFGIINYNNSTGLAYGFMSQRVGSGSFSSWTIKSEQLYYIFQTSAPTTRNILGLVQSYDEGTGALTINSLSSVGTGSTSAWTVISSPKTPVNPGSTQSSFFHPNSPALAVGCWFTGTIEQGTGVSFRMQRSSAGTGWLIIYTGGDNILTPPDDHIIDLYSASPVGSNEILSWQNLIEGTHSFIAISIPSPSGLSTNTRAFIDATTGASFAKSFKQLVNFQKFIPEWSASFSPSQSLGETVFIFKPVDQDILVTWPFHNDFSSTTESREFIVDGITVDGVTPNGSVNPYLRNFKPFTTASCIQGGKIFHREYPSYGNFVQFDSKHVLDKNGLLLEYLRMEIIQALDVNQWYANLFAMTDDFIYPGRIHAEDGEVQETPSDSDGPLSDGSVPMTSTFKGQRSYIFESDNHPDFLLADFWPDITNWRIGELGRGGDHVQNIPGNTSTKFRPYPWSGVTLLPGTVYTIQNRKYLGNRGTLLL